MAVMSFKEVLSRDLMGSDGTCCHQRSGILGVINTVVIVIIVRVVAKPVPVAVYTLSIIKWERVEDIFNTVVVVVPITGITTTIKIIIRLVWVADQRAVVTLDVH